MASKRRHKPWAGTSSVHSEGSYSWITTKKTLKLRWILGVECLLSMCNVLGSIPSIKNTQTKTKKTHSLPCLRNESSQNSRLRWSWTIKGHIKNLPFCAMYNTGAFPSVLAGKWQDISVFFEGHPSCWVKKAFEGGWEEVIRPLGVHSKDMWSHDLGETMKRCEPCLTSAGLCDFNRAAQSQVSEMSSSATEGNRKQGGGAGWEVGGVESYCCYQEKQAGSGGPVNLTSKVWASLDAHWPFTLLLNTDRWHR